jgi:hypothetical protein
MADALPKYSDVYFTLSLILSETVKKFHMGWIDHTTRASLRAS